MVRIRSRRLDLAAASAMLAFVAGAAAPGTAEAQTVRVVSAVVETPDAIFFQPTAFPDVVWYFPRSEVRLFPVSPPTPGANFWRASVELVDVDVNLGDLRPDWEGKSLVPFIVRPTTECVLLRVPEMRFVTQEIRSLGRDVSPAINVPACQFVFRLPLVIPPELEARLEALRASGALITHDLPIRLDLRSSIPWSVVHAAVAAAIGDGDDGDDDDGGDDGDDGDPEAVGPELTPEEARAAIEAALASKALAEVNAAMTDAERLAFIGQVLLQLFDAGELEGSVVLVDVPPAGQLVYHQELIARSM